MATKKANSSKTKEKERVTESFQIKGEELLAKLRELLKEGNIRRVSVKDKNGKTLMEFPLTIGVVGAAIAPVWAALGAIAALVAECTITVEREK